jgi:hypothetical protein
MASLETTLLGMQKKHGHMPPPALGSQIFTGHKPSPPTFLLKLKLPQLPRCYSSSCYAISGSFHSFFQRDFHPATVSAGLQMRTRARFGNSRGGAVPLLRPDRSKSRSAAAAIDASAGVAFLKLTISGRPRSCSD